MSLLASRMKLLRTCGAVVLTGSICSGASAQAPIVAPPYDQERGVYSYAASVETVSASVVKIIAIGTATDQDGRTKTGAIGSGSGVIVDAAKGEILTNNHVVEKASALQVQLVDGRILDATLVGRDPSTDIALLTIKASGLRAITIGDSSTLRIGDLSFAIGYPFGLDQTLTMGIISGLGRSEIGDGLEDFIQTDAAVNSGNSGGALVDSRGRLVGINTAIYSKSGDNAGIAFAVPVNMALAVADQLRRDGKVSRGRIGISIERLTRDKARELGLDNSLGALVAAVEPGSPAAQAGLRAGDVIREAQGRRIDTPGNLTAVLGIVRPGTQVSLGYVRGGQQRTASLVVAEPKRVAVAVEDGRPQALGASFRDIQPSDGYPAAVTGAIVTSVAADSPAARSGLLPKDVIVAVDGQRVESAAGLTSALRNAAGSLTLFVARGNSLNQIKIDP